MGQKKPGKKSAIPKYLTPIDSDELQHPYNYRSLIEMIWIAMCESHPTHSKYLLHIDYNDRFDDKGHFGFTRIVTGLQTGIRRFDNKGHLEFIPLKPHFYVRSFSPSLLRLSDRFNKKKFMPPFPTTIKGGDGCKIDKFIESLRQPADFDINCITLNDILIIHEKLLDFITMLIEYERKDWEDSFKTRSEANERTKDIIKDYSRKNGIAKKTLRQRFDRNPELQRVAK